MSKNFSIAASNKNTATTAAEILRSGGNAVDAAIAAACTAFLAEPIMAQPFGGGFLAISLPQGEMKFLDFFGHTPRHAPPREALDNRAVKADFGEVQQVFHIGSGTIAIPGIASGFAEALEHYGTCPMPILMSAAIAHAREGVLIDEIQAEVFQIVAAIVESNADTKKLYSNPQGNLLANNESLHNPDMEDFLDCWAREGSRFMIEGEGAQALLQVCAEGGAICAEDMQHYQPVWRDPLIKEINGATLAINPPPSAGGVLVVLMLSLLQGRSDPLAIAEVLTKAHHAREAIGHYRDPSIGAALLAPELIADLSARPKAWYGTTHISVMDGDGMGAALTLTNGAGSGIIAPGTGVHLNDMLGEPELIPDAIGAFPENTRLCSMMAPAILRASDRIVMAGGAGSTRIPSAMLQSLIPLIRGACCTDAVQTARLHYERGLNFEDCFGDDVRVQLLAEYPEAQAWDTRAMFFGGVNLVARRPDGSMDAAGDPRRNGITFFQE